MIALLFGVALASVQLESPAIHGQPTVVWVTDDGERPRSGETVRVVHRPGLAGEVEQAIGITDGRGRVKWTPAHGGVASLRAGDEVTSILVADPTPRLDTYLLIALLLVGGVASVGASVWKRS